jgi:hypothetical protein
MQYKEYCDMSTHCWITQPVSKHQPVNKISSRKREGHVIFPYSWCVWRHRGMLRRNRIPILLRDVILSARESCLPAGAWKQVA